MNEPMRPRQHDLTRAEIRRSGRGLPPLTPAEIDQLAAEAPVPLTGAERAARRRGRERRAIASMGGGIAAAGLSRCPHGRLPAVCELCVNAVDGPAQA